MTAIPGQLSGKSSLLQLGQARIDVSPPCAELAMRVEVAGNQRCHISMPAAVKLSGGETTAVHSGALTVLVDTAAGVLAGLQIGSNATLDLRIDHIQPAPAGCLLQAQAEVATQNRQWVKIHTRVLAGDQVIAESVGTFIKRLGQQADILFRLGEEAAAPPEPAHGAARDFISWLGISTADDAGQTYVLPFSSRIVGHPGLQQAHGGVIGAFLEAAALMYLRRRLGHDARTIIVTTGYHRYSGPGPLYARVHPVRIGSRVAALRVDAWQQDINHLTAQLVGNFLVASDDLL